MNLEQFAKAAGVRLFDCGEGWGGRVGYRTKDSPGVEVCGFKTSAAAYGKWLDVTFGKHGAKAARKLLVNSNT